MGKGKIFFPPKQNYLKISLPAHINIWM